MSAAERAYLKAEVDRRSRERLERVDAETAEACRLLSAEEALA